MTTKGQLDNTTGLFPEEKKNTEFSDLQNQSPGRSDLSMQNTTKVNRLSTTLSHQQKT